MSDEIGIMAPATVTNQYLDGQSYLDCSQETAAKVDVAVQRLLRESYAQVKTVLAENRNLMDEIAAYLLAKETITGEELMGFVNAAKEPPKESIEETPEA